MKAEELIDQLIDELIRCAEWHFRFVMSLQNSLPRFWFVYLQIKVAFYSYLNYKKINKRIDLSNKIKELHK